MNLQGEPGAGITKRRLLLFGVAYLITVLVTNRFLINRSGVGLSLSLQNILLIFLLLPYGFLPAVEKWLNSMGITINLLEVGPFPAPANTFADILLVLSYLACLIIPLVGSLTRKERTHRILLLIFIALLVVNAHGCRLMA